LTAEVTLLSKRWNSRAFASLYVVVEHLRSMISNLYATAGMQSRPTMLAANAALMAFYALAGAHGIELPSKVYEGGRRRK
jgi:hypothetical protein